MPRATPTRQQWPVVAWVKLKLPPPERPTTLLGPPLPPDPPLDILEHAPVVTDPRRRIFAFEEELDDGVLRIVWDAENPEVLEAELRAPYFDRRLPRSKVPRFYRSVKERVGSLGPLPILAADPKPTP
ncbi:MAG TPA: hypothetical protein VFF67_05445 [Thermoplasmata archaeon]|nr:hypothetical protein [Thermoplasmata archaeon]